MPVPSIGTRNDDVRRRMCGLVIAGIALEVVFGFGLVAPLGLWKFPGMINSFQPLTTALAVTRAGAIHFLVPVLAAGGLFGTAAWLAGGMQGRRAWVVVLGGTVLFVMTFLTINPAGAQDIYHNVSDART